MYDLSIIIPVYNCEKYIKNCINSIIEQSSDYKIEIIVVNDCSTDNTINILNDYSNLKIIKIIDLKKNGGVSNARNIGVQNANGRYIFFLDGDDMLIPGSISIMLNYINNYSYDIIRFSYKKYFNGISFSKYKYHVSGLLKINNQYNDNVFNNFLKYFDFYSSWGELIKSEIAKKHKFNTNLILGEDMNYNLKLYFKVKNIYVDNEPVMFYRINIGSVTRQYDSKKVIKKALSCYDAYNELSSYDKYNQYEAIIEDKIVDNIVSFFSELYVNDFNSFDNVYYSFMNELKATRPNSANIKKIYEISYIKNKCSKNKNRIIMHRFAKKILNIFD